MPFITPQRQDGKNQQQPGAASETLTTASMAAIPTRGTAIHLTGDCPTPISVITARACGLATISIAIKSDSPSIVTNCLLKPGLTIQRASSTTLASNNLSWNAEKIGLFYDYAAGGDYLKKIHVDAYTQTIERKFENRVKTTQVIPSPAIKALTINNQTNTNDKQYTQGVTLQGNFSLPANNELVIGTQYQHDKIKQDTDGQYAPDRSYRLLRYANPHPVIQRSGAKQHLIVRAKRLALCR